MTNAISVQPRRFSTWLGGLILLGLGAVLIIAGVIQTTTSRLTITGCPSGTELLAKFEWNGHRYTFERPTGNENIVTITNGTSHGGDAHSTVKIAAVVVKGGSASKTTWFSPPQSNVHFSNQSLPTVGHGNLPAISNVQFCKPTTPPPTTEPATTPPTSPETTPVTEPQTTPPTSPETTPGTEPQTTPPTSPETTPGTTPETTPVTSPVTTPTQSSAPVTQPTETSAPTTQPVAGSTTTSVEQEAVVVTSTSVVVNSTESALPHTGAPSALLITLGAVLMALGMALAIVGRARDRRANS